MRLTSAKNVGLAMTLQLLILPVTAMALDYFAALDTNRDDVLSGTEATLLKALDADGDGEISRQEYAAGMIKMKQKVHELQEQKFRELDLNQDLRLSGKEITDDVRSYDANHDGRIPLDEYLSSINGLQSQFADLSADQIVDVAKELFASKDANKDGRLSGKEITRQLQHYDANRDGRVTLEEFTALAVPEIMSASSSGSPGPASNESGPQVLRTLIEAVRTQSSEALMRVMNPRLQEQVDAVLIDFALSYIHDRIGEFSMPPAEKLARDPESDASENRWLVTLEGSQGQVAIHARLEDGQLIGFNYAGPIMEGLNQDLNQRLMGNQDFSMKFAQFYSPMCQKLIELVDKKKDAAAFAMIHPDVQKQVGREKFNAIFGFIREHLGKLEGTELESLTVEIDADGDAMIRIHHLAGGTKGDLTITNTFQVIGLKCHMVGVAAAESKEIDPNTPLPPPQPVAPPKELPLTPAAPPAPLVGPAPAPPVP